MQAKPSRPRRRHCKSCHELFDPDPRTKGQQKCGEKMFDKSKVILTQLTGGKEDDCYLTRGGRGLYVRLTKASPLSKTGSIGDNRRHLKRVVNRLPRGRLYALSMMFP